MNTEATIGKFVLVGVAAMFLAGMAWADDPVVESVVAKQRPGTKLVDITFTVRDDDSNQVVIWISAVNNETGEQIPVRHLTGDTLIAPGTHTLCWDAGADWDGNATNDLGVTVRASDILVTYLVIDLSAGPSAAQYPYAMRGPIPDLLLKPEYKTTKLVLRSIPAGPFRMGSPPDELGRYADPRELLHEVMITKPFYIGVFEVTQKQWELVMGANPSEDRSGDKHPVEYVSWEDIRGGTWPGGTPAADTFMGRLRGKTPFSLDLPTEAQWEYACRAGTDTAYNNGTDITDIDCDPNLDPLAWYNCNSDGKHHEVGLKQPNAWGLHDCHGNVFERVLDWYDDYQDGVAYDPVGPEVGTRRAYRSSTYLSRAKFCRSAYRNKTYPHTRSLSTGFRAATAPQQP